MSTEDKRDLNTDLAICDAATAGPWALEDEWLSVFHEDSGGTICDVGDPYPRGDNRPAQNMRFIAEARTGWPHAIKRAMAAERWREEALKASLRANTAEQRAHELEAEVKRLRGALERMDDRENPMIPRSEMARIAKETLDSEVSANV